MTSGFGPERGNTLRNYIMSRTVTTALVCLLGPDDDIVVHYHGAEKNVLKLAYEYIILLEWVRACEWTQFDFRSGGFARFAPTANDPFRRILPCRRLGAHAVIELTAP